MALIKCPDCGMEISDKAPACPVCGCPMQPVTAGGVSAEMQAKASGNNSTTAPQPQPTPAYRNAALAYQNPVPQPQPQPVPPKKKESAVGIIGLILSVFFCLPIFPVVGLILCIIALCDKKHSSKCATIGLIICIFSILLGILAPQYMKYVDEARENNQSESNINTADEADAEPVLSESTNTVTDESSSAPDNTNTAGREEFIASCEEIPYKTLARYPEDNAGKHIVLTVQITQIVQGGLFDDSVYYRVYTDNDGYGLYLSDEYLMYDARIGDDTKLLADDIIRVYGEFIGTESIVRALTGTAEDIPAFKAYYIDILDLVEDDMEYITLEKFNQIDNGMSYDEVVEIIGSEGTVLTSIDLNGEITTYEWYAKEALSYATVTFEDGIVTSKMQIGLE